MAQATSRPRTMPGAISTSACASTPWAAALNGMAVSKVRPFGAHLLQFQRLHAAHHPAGGDHGNSRHLTSSPTTPSAWARTARRTNPSSNWRLCAPCPGLMLLRPGDANEVVEAWKVIMQAEARAGGTGVEPAGHAHLDRSKYASAAGVAKGAYILADAADGKPEVILMGTGSEVSLCVERLREADKARRESARGQYAFMGSFRASGATNTKAGSAAGGEGAGLQSNRPPPSAGRNTSALPASSSACRHSELRRRSRNCRRNSGSAPTNVVEAARNQWANGKQ